MKAVYDRVELLEVQYKVRFAEHASIENSAKMDEYLKHSNWRVEGTKVPRRRWMERVHFLISNFLRLSSRNFVCRDISLIQIQKCI